MVEGEVEVILDRDGVPHIYASNDRDLYCAQGYIHARDRLFQMDLTRREVSGDLAEVLGPSVVGRDVQSRTVGLRRAAERSKDEALMLARRAVEADASSSSAALALSFASQADFDIVKARKMAETAAEMAANSRSRPKVGDTAPSWATATAPPRAASIPQIA